jgi:hypothetical protein
MARVNRSDVKGNTVAETGLAQVRAGEKEALEKHKHLNADLLLYIYIYIYMSGHCQITVC